MDGSLLLERRSQRRPSGSPFLQATDYQEPRRAGAPRTPEEVAVQASSRRGTAWAIFGAARGLASTRERVHTEIRSTRLRVTRRLRRS